MPTHVFIAMIATLSLFPSVSQAAEAATSDPDTYPNLLDLRQGSPNDPSGYFMSDLGCWHAYGYCQDQAVQRRGGFRGPFIMTGLNGSRWLSEAFERLQLIAPSGTPIELAAPITTYCPGSLRQTLRAGDLQIELRLIALSGRTTMTEYRIVNQGKTAAAFTPRWSGTLADAKDRLAASADAHAVQVSIGGQKRPALLRFPETVTLTLAQPQSYVASNAAPISLPPGQSVAYHTFMSYGPAETLPELTAENRRFDELLAGRYFADNRVRWQKQLATLLDRPGSAYLQDPRLRNWAVKSMLTLNTNWRSAAGDLKHGGIYPSTTHFNAFWAWDSFEHAAATAAFNPELAKDQIRAVFDLQTPEGMIIDLVALERKDNNPACSKPPLAGWATYLVFKQTGDLEFVREMYPKLLKYHRWRYRYRDHNHNGLCEYGGIRPEVMYGQWESGMDVAVKFDGVKMIKVSEGAYSFNQESVELNAYLYAEKLYLAELAEAIGKPADADRFRAEAPRLRQLIQTKMFDAETGFFYDINSETGAQVKVIDVSGWIPLFTGVASPEQAKRVHDTMLDPKLFGTFFPFSSLNHQHPQYHPEKGYFRGQTWMNYTYFGIRGFKNYGFAADADRFTRLIPDRLEGIADPGFPIRENYSSANGKGLCATHFSWSSAFSILLLVEDTFPFEYLLKSEPATVAQPTPWPEDIGLAAAEAKITGRGARLDGTMIQHWDDVGTIASWETMLPSGDYDVVVIQAAAAASAGNTYQVEIGGKSLPGTVKDTGGWMMPQEVSLGKIKIEKGGNTTITLRPLKKGERGVMNLQGIVLRIP
jgi:putative isomerase